MVSASQELGGGGACEGTAAVVELAECDPALGCSNRGDLSISKARPQSTCLKASALFAMPERRSTVVWQHRQAA